MRYHNITVYKRRDLKNFFLIKKKSNIYKYTLISNEILINFLIFIIILIYVKQLKTC